MLTVGRLSCASFIPVTIESFLAKLLLSIESAFVVFNLESRKRKSPKHSRAQK